MADNTLDVPYEIQSEVQAGLAILKKTGYRVTSEQQPTGELFLHFQLGENQQTLKFAGDEWRNSTVIQNRIVDKLEI